MILLTRLGGGLPVALNPDLIERAEPTPDTVITLVDGHKLLVSESVADVIELIRQWRAEVAASAYALTQVRLTQAPIEHVPFQGGNAGQPDGADDAVGAHDILGNSLARVFRLPHREG